MAVSVQERPTAADHPPRRLRSRIARLRASHTYVAVLVAIVVVFAFTVAAPNAGWARSVLVLLEGATLVVAAWTTGLIAHATSILRSVVALCVPVAVVGFAVNGSGSAGAAWLAGMLLLVATGAVLVVGVFDQNAINRQSILGAVCVYLLLGLVFAHIYGAVAALGPGHFFAQGTDGTASIRTYFSYVTLATLGYGDYTPADGLGRTLAIVEALLGQLYLVTVIAVLVSRVGRSRSTD